jgi:nicotinate-nucleotide pyrophosphorylase (carboxylating)
MELTAVDVRAWLAEDLGEGDLTSDALVPEDATAAASILLKERGVVSGLEVARAVFAELDPNVRYDPLAADGEQTEGEIARLEGRARALLGGERLALNLLGRLSGIATLTQRYVEAVAGTGAEILDTRKTTPGLRTLEKYAVRCGGGRNHRLALDDGIMIDNMTSALLTQAVALTGGRAKLEASGGVTLENVRTIAETGVDFVSIGALTHSAQALDVSMEVA